MRKVVYYKNEKQKRWTQKVFDTEKSIYICQTPQGKLYKKKNANEYFTWKDGEEKPVIVTWAEANSLTRSYGTREQHLEMFTLYEKSTNPNDGKSTQVRLSSYYRVKATRNAQRLGLSLKAYIERLIDKDDENRNYQ